METIQEVKQMIDNGSVVYWASLNYKVMKDSLGQYLIHSISNNHYVGLTDKYDPSIFFTNS